VGEVRDLEESFSTMSAGLKQRMDHDFRGQIAARDARIEALSRINPQFVSNVLEMVNWQARLDNNMKIASMIDALSTLLKAAMDRSGEQMAVIQDELAMAEAYFRLIKLRYGDKLSITTRMDAAARGCMLPRRMIESLIENAVGHGIAPVGKGTIELDVRRQGDDVVIIVSNDGQPLSELDKDKIQTAFDLSRPTEGIGLRNAKTRLDLIYGGAAEISLTSLGDRRTEARVRLPYRTEANG